MSPRRQFPHLKESQLRSLGTPAALEAGRRAWQSGAVAQTMYSLREPMLLGSVQDESGRLCHASVRHLAGDEFGPLCDCADDGFCAHVMALLLEWVHDSHAFSQALPPAPAVPEASDLRQQWSEHLRGTSMNQLRAIARRHELSSPATDRESMTAQLLDLLAEPGHVTQSLAALSERERRMLQMVYLLSDGASGISAAELQEALGWPGADAELHALRDAGLVVGVVTPGQPMELYAPGPGVTVSAVVVSESRGFESVGQFAGDFAPLRIAHSEWYLPEMLLLTRHMQLRPRPVPPDPVQAQGIAALRRWPFLIPEVVKLQVKPGWNHQAESTLTVPVPLPWLDDASLVQMRSLGADDVMNDFVARLAASTVEPARPPATLSEVFAAWQALANWTELWSAQQRAGLRVRRRVTNILLTYAGWLQQQARARRFVSRLLSLLEPGIWYDFGSLLAAIQEVRPQFMHDSPSAEPLGWWLEPLDKDAEDPDTDSWQTTDGLFVAELLRGPLLWLGAVEIALDMSNEPGTPSLLPTPASVRAFRLTPPGIALLRGAELPPAGAARPIVLGNDLSVRVKLGRQDLGAYRLLEQIAHFQQLQDGEAQYKFDLHAAHAAFAHGYSGEDIVHELERLSAAEVPALIRSQWLEWWLSYAQTRWYEGLTLIELADDYILQELLAQTDLRQHLLFTFGPRLVAVRPDSADAFARQLVKKGYTPRIE